MALQFSQTIGALRVDSPRSAHVAWGTAGLFLLGWTAWFAFSSIDILEVSQRARIEVRRAPHQLDALAAGQIARSELLIGKHVNAGDVLIELDSTRDRHRLAEEQARLVGMDARMESLLREIDARGRSMAEDAETARAATEVARARAQEALATLEFAKGAAQRADYLSSVRSGSPVESLKAAAELQKSQASLAGWEAEAQRIDREAAARHSQSEAQIESLKQAVAALRTDQAATGAAVERLRAELEKQRLKAPISGQLADVSPLRIGAYVAEGQKLATILPIDELMIVGEFAPSVAFGRVATGQSAKLRLDGFPWGQYGVITARVTNVAGEIRDGLVRVELAVGDVPPTGIRPQHGLPGSVEVMVESVSPAQLALRTAGMALSGGGRAEAAR